MSFNTNVVRVPRIGFGYDSHEFKPGITLKIGGVVLPHDQGLAGHSDGDVLLHALTDALLGAVAAGDIGSYFPPSDPQWKGADSAVFLREASETDDVAWIHGRQHRLHAGAGCTEDRATCEGNAGKRCGATRN